MANSKKHSNVMPIGIDLGSESIKIAQMRYHNGQPSLAAASVTEIPDHARNDSLGRLEFFSRSIPEAIASGGFKGKECVVSLPASTAFVRHLKIPRLDAKSTQAAVMRAAQDVLSYPVSQALIKYIVTGDVYHEGETRQEIILIAIPETTMEAHLDMLHKAKLKVVAVSIEPLAIIECFGNIFDWAAGDDDSIMYVDMGYSSTQVVVGHGKNLVFVRNIERGSKGIIEAICEDKEVTENEALEVYNNAIKAGPDSSEYNELLPLITPWLETVGDLLDKSLLYYQSVYRKAGAGKVLFTGGLSSDRRLCQMLAQRLNLPAQVGDPGAGLADGVQLLEMLGITSPMMAVSMGLSLGDWEM